ncbi:MAG: hypothetical protein HeimC3_29360 [Candidatus Heimdallarchaeota archaeon LC_3]|nr:MAG: hypothetical protein HeimC3_29360 [Candidatus Heimdallarchaeota archaeon LC_3]
MKIKLKIKFITIFPLIFLVFAGSFAVIPLKADSIPVVNIEFVSEKFTPTSINNHSLYIVEPGYIGPDTQYVGKPANVQYTTAGSNNYGDNNPSINSGEDMPTDSLTSPERSSDNPFFEDEVLPRLVNITEATVNLTNSGNTPFSLHFGYSFTFFFNKTLMYTAMVNATTPFFLDVQVYNPNAKINFDLTGTLFPNTVETAEDTNSYAIFPAGNETLNINIWEDNNVNSLVSLTPLPIDVEQFSPETIEPDQYFFGSVEQGECFDLDSDPKAQPTQDLLDMQLFQFPVTRGNVYQIFFFQDDIYEVDANFIDKCGTGSLSAFQTDLPDDFGYISGNLNANGRVIQALENGTANVLLVAERTVFKEFSFYFREANDINIPKPPENLPLVFNQAINLSIDDFYNFTVSEPSVLAINRTSGGGYNSAFSWYQLDPLLDAYLFVSSSSFSIENGNLYGDSLGDIGTNWIYLPAGDYGFEVSGGNTVNFNFTFNLIPVMDPFSGSTTLDIDNSSLYAIELPLVMATMNYLNFSTLEQNNLTISYEYSIIGKFARPTNEDLVNHITSNFEIGNEQDSGNWIGYGADGNETNERIYMPTRTNFVPILIFRPYSAINSTADPQSEFNSSIVVSSNVMPYEFGDLGDRDFINGNNIADLDYIPKLSSEVTSQVTVDVNSDISSINNVIYGFPLRTSPNAVYRVTVTTTGNYTDTLKNITINEVNLHGGNYNDLLVFGQSSPSSTNTTNSLTLTIMTLTQVSYAFIEITRVSSRNGTLTVAIEKLSISNVNIPNLVISSTWNSTTDPGEIEDTTPLWNISDYTYSGTGGGKGIDVGSVLLLLGVGGAVVVGGGALVYFVRKRKVTGKFP